MKKAYGLLLAALLLAAGLGCARGEERFGAWLQGDGGWQGWTAVSQDQMGEWAAALLARPAGDGLMQGYALCLAHQQEGHWITAVRDDEGLVYTDAIEQAELRFEEGQLVLSWNEAYFEPGDTVNERRYALEQGEWRLQEAAQARRETMIAKEERPIVTESRAWRQNGQVHRETLWRDAATGAVYARRIPGPLPDITEPAWLAPSRIGGDSACLDAGGYGIDGGWSPWSQAILSRLCAYFFPGETYVDGLYQPDALQFIVDRADGSRVLRCGRYDEGTRRWEFAESTPLPADAGMGFENYWDAVRLADHFGVKIGWRNGAWAAVYGYGGTYDADDWFYIGANWVGESINGPRVYGDHPWGDITAMDWASFPRSLKEAVSRLDCARWATPNNPDLDDRLNLREAPRKDAGSLGKYYNGAPVEVLERGKEWCKVRIGAAQGWMMTRYLAFGRAAGRVETWLNSYLLPARAEVLVQWQDTGEGEIWGPDRNLGDLLVIGVQGDAWYIVMEWATGRVGRVRTADIWEGNG